MRSNNSMEKSHINALLFLVVLDFKSKLKKLNVSEKMIAAFTICSANYLPQAIVLAMSVKTHAPDWSFTIGLVDDIESTTQFQIPSYVNIIEVNKIGLSNLHVMTCSYNIIELCTAVKPSYFKEIFRRHAEVKQVHYLDPDTVLFTSPAELEDALQNSDITLTPHHLTPLPLDGNFPAENLALNHGVYNLGYLGVKRTPNSMKMIDWWEALMAEHCRIDLAHGWFVDQLPMNYVPIYFTNVTILTHPGVNVAYWNLHERRVKSNAQVGFRNETWPLVLFHFSGFSPLDPRRITRAEVRLDQRVNPGLGSLLNIYAQNLLENGWERARGLTSSYQIEYQDLYKKRLKLQNSPSRRISRGLRRLFFIK